MKKNITIHLHIGEIVVTGRTHNQTSVANAVVAELNRILSTAFEITKDDENTCNTQRVNPSKAVRIERHFSRLNKLGVMFSAIPISRLNDNSQLLNAIETFHNIIAEFEQNNDNLMRCECPILQKKLEDSMIAIAPMHQQNSNHELANCKFLIEYAQRLISELSRACQHPNTISEQRRQNLYRASLRFQLDTESLLDLDNLEKDARHVGVVGCSNPFDKQHTKSDGSL